jgi:hypothetical protein
MLQAPIELELDVTDAVASDVPLHVAATLFLPDTAPVALVACLHGGGYDRRYFHLTVPGHEGYSMGAHLARRGCAVLAFDCLTIGESSRLPEGADADGTVFTVAHDAAVRQVAGGLRDGSLGTVPSGDPPLPVVGVGHSLGGSLVTIQQARGRTYDRIAVLGTTAFERPWGGEFALKPVDDGLVLDREALRSDFYWNDVPAAVIAADEAAGVPLSVHAVTWAAEALGLASAIDVPVFIGLGERDVSEDPHREPSAYTASDDVTLFLLRSSGHCHNLAGGRARMWDRIAAWIAG